MYDLETNVTICTTKLIDKIQGLETHCISMNAKCLASRNMKVWMCSCWVVEKNKILQIEAIAMFVNALNPCDNTTDEL